jgi:catechol 2,3-dioxygenase-like lactoylglutathione lyase family enzyme
LIFDHIGISVSDFAKSIEFYRAALAPLGVSVVMEVPKELTGGMNYSGFGRQGKPDFWLGDGKKAQTGIHIAFAAQNRAEVDAFYKAAIGAGGKDNGKPGIRSDYHPNYYGAFVLDLDGNNVEAVCHKPE